MPLFGSWREDRLGVDQNPAAPRRQLELAMRNRRFARNAPSTWRTHMTLPGIKISTLCCMFLFPALLFVDCTRESGRSDEVAWKETARAVTIYRDTWQQVRNYRRLRQLIDRWVTAGDGAVPPAAERAAPAVVRRRKNRVEITHFQGKHGFR